MGKRRKDLAILAMDPAGEMLRVARSHVAESGLSQIITTAQLGVFAGLPRQFTVNRYHSLAIEKSSIPDVLEVTAWTGDGEIMGVRHKTLPIEGVQFHPESILTEHGHAMLQTFLIQSGQTMLSV